MSTADAQTTNERWFTDEQLEEMSRADDGPRACGDRGRRPRSRTRGLRGDAPRVGHAPRPDGRGNARPRDVHPGPPRRRGRRGGVGGVDDARLAPPRRGDRPDPAQARRRAAGRDMARALAVGDRRGPRVVHGHRGRGEADLPPPPLRLGGAARAARPLRARGLRAHARRARLVVRSRADAALLHALRVHERVAAAQVVGLPAVSARPAAGLRHRSVPLVLVQGSGGDPRPLRSALRPARGGRGRRRAA